MYHFYRYYLKKNLLRNSLQNYFKEEDFIFLIKQYEELRKNLNFNKTILIIDITHLELIQQEVIGNVVSLLQQYSRENYLGYIFIMPFSLIAKYQFERVITGSRIECIKVKNSKETLKEINNFRKKECLKCI